MVLDQIVWIGTASYDFQHVRTRRGTKVKSSCVDSIDKRFVSDCVEQACVADIDVHGVSHIKSWVITSVCLLFGRRTHALIQVGSIWYKSVSMSIQRSEQ